MRSSTDPKLIIEWESFNKVDRHDRQRQATDTTWHSGKEASTAD